jgi:hypothetical protein
LHRTGRGNFGQLFEHGKEQVGKREGIFVSVRVCATEKMREHEREENK